MKHSRQRETPRSQSANHRQRRLPEPALPDGSWRYRTAGDQQTKLEELVASGMSVKDAARELGINYSPARSKIQAARRPSALAN
jgi:hypothetical protein